MDRCSPCPLKWCKQTAYEDIVELGSRNQCALCPSTRTQPKAMTPLQHMLVFNDDSRVMEMKEDEAARVLEREGSTTELRKHGLALSPRGRCRELLDGALTERPLAQQGKRRSCSLLLLLSSTKSSTISIF